MKSYPKISMLTIIILLGISACTPAATPQVQIVKPTEVILARPTATPAPILTSIPAMAEKATIAPSMEVPGWYSVSLLNVLTGKNFSINDFKGKVVLVETMAQWCSNCKKQQGEIKTLVTKIGKPDDLVVVVLDIDPNEKADALKSYAVSNGFDWYYAVSPEQVSREIGNLYSAQFLNPPSTPILVIDRKGKAHPLPFGIKSADDLLKAVDPYLKGM